MKREITEEMNALSKEVYGSSSRWRKLMDKGVPELWEREKEVVIPTRNGQVKTKVFKEHKYSIKRFTLEEVKEEMLKVLASRKGIELALKDLPTTQHTPSVQAYGADQTAQLSDGSTATAATAE